MGVKKQAAFSTIEVGDAISGISKSAAFPGYHERMYKVCVTNLPTSSHPLQWMTDCIST